jgi:sn-glycerol 3-phosphate transport system substrate-binding protein
MNVSLKRMLGAAVLAGSMAMGTSARAETTLQFYFPVAVGGPITKIIDGMVADFEKANPTIKVKPIYAGSYQDTLTKVLTAIKGGDVPQLSVILAVDMYTLIDEDAIVPIDSLLKTEDDKKWLAGFYPGFMENSRTGGKTWGVPFQRSTIVMYWNKDAFKDAGLDPEKPPQSWDELVAYGQKLTKRDDKGNVTQWGVQIPSSGFPYWLFQALTTQNNVRLMNEAGTKTNYDDPKVVEALQFWVDLSRKHKIHPPGIVDWGTTPKDFFERKVAIMWTTTGNLTNVRANAKFPFGVAMMPAKTQRGSPTGGGNFYVFKKSTPAQQAASLTFMKWMTSPEQAAKWGIATGYVAVSPAAWQTPAMQAYVKEFPPAAIARDQLQYAWAELSTHENQRVTKALNDGLQAALIGTKPAAAAMKDAQAEAERILKAYR